MSPYLHPEWPKPEVWITIVEEDASQVGVEVGHRAEDLAAAEGVEVLP